MSDEEIITRALLSVDFDVDYYDHPSRADDMPTRLRGADSISPTAAEYAAAVAAALREAGRLVPDGSVTIEAARFDRLLALIRAYNGFCTSLYDRVTHDVADEYGDRIDAIDAAWEAIQPSDFAPR